jgi:hypothetical protein
MATTQVAASKKKQFDAYTLNDITAKKNPDGSQLMQLKKGWAAATANSQLPSNHVGLGGPIFGE